MSDPTNPFTEGYMTAIRASIRAPEHAPFSDETLARVIADCAAWRKLGSRTDEGDAIDGRHFWSIRQRGQYPSFPPLTPCVGDDGKVHLRESRP